MTRLERVLYVLFRLVLGPARPAPAAIGSSYRRESPVGIQLYGTFTPAPFASADIVKATITPIVNGAAQPPIDTTGGMVSIPCSAGDVLTNTETVTDKAGFVSDPSPPSAPFTVVDPRPAAPPPATMGVAVKPAS